MSSNDMEHRGTNAEMQMSRGIEEEEEATGKAAGPCSNFGSKRKSKYTHTHTHTRTQNVSKKSPISALPSCFYRVFTRASGVLRLAFPFLVGATIRYGLTVLPLPFFFIFLVEYRCKIRFATAFRAIFPPIPSLSCS